MAVIHPILKAEELTIRFGDFEANKDITLSVYAGEIHSIVGENGAGKSTLMKMLYGVYTPTEGSIRVDGLEVQMTPAVAIKKGIGMVFQDFRLIPAFSALDNILLAMPKEERKKGRDQIRRKIEEISERYRIPVNPDMLVANMDLGQRQRVEIIKVMMMGKMRVLIFDEPTSVLTDEEAVEFIHMISSLRDGGYAIILITHKLDEVISCSDKITVLRHGAVAARQSRKNGFNKEELIQSMMGGTVELHSTYDDMKKAVVQQVPMLSMKAVEIHNSHGITLLRDANLDLHGGEITGLAGISGKGQRELLDVLYGVQKPVSGTVLSDESDLTGKSIEERIRRGITLVSEDPIRDNVVPGMRIFEHFAIENPNLKYKKIGIDWDELKDSMDQLDEIQKLRIPDKNRIVSSLSGGNIQRVMLARAAMKHPKVLLASYPSRGLDVGMVETVHQIFIRLRNEGSAILFVSEDLDELLSVSDRIVIITGNTLSRPYAPDELTRTQIGELMVGGDAA